MIYKNEIIENLLFTENKEGIVEENITISNCIIDKLSIPGGTCLGQITITDCIINDFNAVGRYFEGGLLLSNCIINDRITFEAGGHNRDGIPFMIANNVFNCFVDFFDAHFDGHFTFRNNILLKGSNLSGSQNTLVPVLFNGGMSIENNIGDLGR